MALCLYFHVLLIEAPRPQPQCTATRKEKRASGFHLFTNCDKSILPILCPFPGPLTSHARRRENAKGYCFKNHRECGKPFVVQPVGLVVHTDAGLFVGRRNADCVSHALLIAPLASLSAPNAIVACSCSWLSVATSSTVVAATRVPMR